jgi:hypothetical protein
LPEDGYVNWLILTEEIVADFDLAVQGDDMIVITDLLNVAQQWVKGYGEWIAG